MLIERHISPLGNVVFACFHPPGTDPMSVVTTFERIWREKGYQPSVLTDNDDILGDAAMVVDRFGNLVTASLLVVDANPGDAAMVQ